MAKIKTQNQYYIRLGELMNDIIPEEWTELAIYVEFPKTRPVFKAFFRNGKDGRFLEINEIPEKYPVSRYVFEQQCVNLTAFFMDLRRAYEKENKGRDCKTISLFVVEEQVVSEYTAPLNEKYSYEKRLAIWKYKEIGVIDNPEDASVIEKHFGNVNRSVIQGVKRKPYKDTSTRDEFLELFEIIKNNLWRFTGAGRTMRAIEAEKQKRYWKFRNAGK